jgi:HlyD family secretion protein
VSKKTKFFAIAIVLLASIAGFAIRKRVSDRSRPLVRVETIERRDLKSVVMASGEILPTRSVNISADTIGRVTRLAVKEGEYVKAGQFLLQIDPEALESAVQSGEAGLQAAREAVNTVRAVIDVAGANHDLAVQNRDRMRALYQDQLISREMLDRAEKEVQIRESELREREAELLVAEQRLEQGVAELRSARHHLSKVTIESPMNGLITQLNIEEGETVLVGTMNNPGTVIMTIADLSVVQAELEVDETDIVDLRVGQEGMIRIDALPGREFPGRITKIGSSARRSRNPFQVANAQQAANFEVIVTVDGEVSEARPGFSCSAEMITATTSGVIAVPIQALTTRRLEASSGAVLDGAAPENGANDGFEAQGLNDETEGVFVVREDSARFTPIRIGLTGQRFFEVLSGLEEGDKVIVGPFSSVRELSDGSRVRIAAPGEDLHDRRP